MSRVFGLGIFLTVVFQHFQISSVGGYPITLGAILGVPIVMALVRKIRIELLLLVWLSILIPSGLVVLGDSSTDVLVEYFRTLVLFLAASSIIVMAISVDARNLRFDAFDHAVLWAQSVIVSLSLLQIIFGALGVDTFFNPFGPFQYLYDYKPHLEPGSVPRAQGFFLEPSYNSFVIGTLGVVLLARRKYQRMALILTTVGLIACQSATGIVIFAAILVWMALRSRPGAAVSALIGIAILWSVLGSYIAGRISSIGDPGSSGNYRLMAPLEVLADVVAQHPIGMPLGSVETAMAKYGLENGAKTGTSLDNGYYVLIFYFGWLGLIASLAFIFFMLRGSLKLRAERRDLSWTAPIWLAGSLMFSGGIMLPEFAIMTSLVIIAIRVPLERRGGAADAGQRPTSVVHRHRYLSGPSRA